MSEHETLVVDETSASSAFDTLVNEAGALDTEVFEGVLAAWAVAQSTPHGDSGERRVETHCCGALCAPDDVEITQRDYVVSLTQAVTGELIAGTLVEYRTVCPACFAEVQQKDRPTIDPTLLRKHVESLLEEEAAAQQRERERVDPSSRLTRVNSVNGESAVSV